MFILERCSYYRDVHITEMFILERCSYSYYRDVHKYVCITGCFCYKVTCLFSGDDKDFPTLRKRVETSYLEAAHVNVSRTGFTNVLYRLTKQNINEKY